MQPNFQRERWEPAATNERKQTERNSWLPSAPHCGWAAQFSHGCACGLQLDQSVAQPVTHVKLYRRSPSAGSARLPRKNDSAAAGDWLVGAGIIDLPDLPAEECANCEDDKGNSYAVLVSRQKP